MSAGPSDQPVPPERRVYCNRTLNMRGIQVVGFDMDYTLVHYDVHAWEARAYWHVQQRLVQLGLPVAELAFDPERFARGLIVDTELGNIVKANRFGYVTQAAHGTTALPHDRQRQTYSQVWIDLAEPRWVFLNTLFSLSEACLYGQLVDLLDQGRLPGMTYASVYELVSDTINQAHLEGQLKAEIIAAPERFVDLDPDLPQTLLDLKQAGKKLFLATNSEWHYTRAMMGFAFDRAFGASHWRELFDLVVVQARKPRFFREAAPFFAVDERTEKEHPVDEGSLRAGVVYRGGSAEVVQRHFGVTGGDVLYVGDHVYADVHVSSEIHRWRTALILRELEHEVAAERAFAPEQRELAALMQQKAQLDERQARLRLWQQRREQGGPLPADVDVAGLGERLRELRQQSVELDQRITPLAQASGRLGHAVWGPSMRAGNDKSRLARQIEGHADIYTSRVSNLLHVTPFGYLRAAHGALPHDVTA